MAKATTFTQRHWCRACNIRYTMIYPLHDPIRSEMDTAL